MDNDPKSKTDGKKTRKPHGLPLTIRIPLKPVPASRPRIPRYGKPYFLKTYAGWREEAHEYLRRAGNCSESIPVRAYVVFAIPRAKQSKLLVPTGDGDNYEKAIYDALQSAGILGDDKWITTATWRKRFVPHGEAGYTEITLEEEDEQLDYGL